MTSLFRILSATIVTALAFLSLASPSEAQKGRDWELLGSAKVGFLADRDVIRVGKREGRYKRIKLLVSGNEIEMRDLKVVYGNGRVDDLPVRETIRAGGETRAIDLKGEGRFIKEVQLAYASKPNFRGQATVQVYGLQE